MRLHSSSRHRLRLLIEVNTPTIVRALYIRHSSLTVPFRRSGSFDRPNILHLLKVRLSLRYHALKSIVHFITFGAISETREVSIQKRYNTVPEKLQINWREFTTDEVFKRKQDGN
jgi:hypothetical protein